MSKFILSVPDMSCEHCVKVITEALETILPSSDFEVILSTKQVILRTEDSRIVEKAEEALRDEGYTSNRVL